jgi:VanZ family protein
LKYKIVSIFILFIILAFTISPKETIDIKLFEHSDKIKHIIAFFTLSFFLYKSFENIKNKYKFYSLVIFACVIEIIQSFVGREASIADFMASCFGVLLYLLILKVRKKNRL